MADNQVSSSRQSQDASSTSAQPIQPSSSGLIGSDGSTAIQANTATTGINPTPSSNVAGPFVTSPGQSDKTQLYSSSSGSSQFPMQHSTQPLPSNTVPIATTQFTKTDALTTDNQKTKVTAGLSSSSSSDILKDSSVVKDSSISMATADISSSSAHSQSVSSVSNPTNVSSSHLDSSEYEPSVSSTESATSFNSKSISTSLSLTSATVVPKLPPGSSVKLKASVSSSSEYLASSGEMYNPITASKTLYSSSIIALDSSAALKTTPVTPLTPPSVKPVGPSGTGSTSLLGGGLSNYYVYIGVPLCGLGILIFLIVCVICLRKRKTKSQGSPAKNHVQDLWVNSQPEISMAPQQGPPLEEGHLGRGGDIIGGQKELGACTTYECMYDFAASLETHLTLQKGDQVRVHRKEDNGWWRGTTGDTTGWFPANYVQAAPQVKLETENEVEMHNDSHVTSFMVKKQAEDSQRDSCPTEDEIRAEPIYCKIQPKEKRKSLPGNGDKAPTKYATMLNRESTITPIDDGSKYMAIYDYNGHFHGELSLTKGDIIQGREQDRNGWMAGYNETSKEDGWFPTVYVQKIEKEEPCELDLDPASYKRLEVNTRSDSKQDLVGIVHKAVNTFTAEKAGDLEFDVGELITVFQVLENGWWLGCKDKTVGWFPGAFVQMVDQPSPRAKTPSPTNVPKPSSDSPVTTDNTNTPSGLSTPKTSKLRPARKAPPPPKQDPYTDATTSTPSVTSTPKVNRPKTCPPTPPQRSGYTDEISPLYETIGQNKPTDSIPQGKSPTTDGLYELIKHPDADSDPSVTIPPKDKTKPAIPKRYIKPKLVTVRRSEVNMPNSLTRDSTTLETPRSRPPPPQRPLLPKLGPVRPKLQAPKTIKDQSQSEDEDNFFNISTQSKLEPLIRQDSSDHDESVSYKGLSSFGSTFGSTFGRKETSPPKMNNEKNVTSSDDVESGRIEEVPKKGIPKLVKLPAIGDTDIKKVNEHLPAQSNMQKPKENTQGDRNTETFDLSENMNDKINVLKPDTNMPEANIENQKKKEKPVSKLPPPKHISLKPAADPVVQSENKDTKSPGTPKSKLPSMHETEDVSKVPMSYKDIQHNKIEDSNLKDESLLNKEPIKSDELSAKDAISGASNNISVVNDHLTPDEELRPRTDSFDKPPVAPKPKSKGLPKLLPKPKAGLKSHESDDDNKIVHNLDSNTDVDHSMSNSPDVRGRKSESEEDSEPKRKEEPKTSKLPLGSKIAQKSPQVKGKKSKIPASPIVKKKGSDSSDKQLTIRKTSESDSDAPLSPVNIRHKPESPRSPRKASPRQKMANNETTSLRQRSNSPRAKGIPTSVRQRSSSPATKLPKSSNIPSSATPNMSNKSSGLVPPKKVTNGQGRASPNDETDSLRSQSTPSPDTSLDQSFDNQDSDSLSPKPDRPSKPPRVLKQKSVDGKPPKKGKSLLPVIHKSMDAGSSPNGVSPSPGNKNKRGIPVAKPPRPPGPKLQSEDTENGGPIKRTLNQAMKGYIAECDGELTFTEGTFVKELSDCDRPGWYVGMLADGTTGLYPADHFVPSPVTAQHSEA